MNLTFKQMLLAIALAMLIAAICSGQTISTKALVVGSPIKIALTTAYTTALLFPSQPSGVFGLGLGSGNNNNTGCIVQLEHPDGSDVLVLHALTENAHIIATVLLENQLYVFDLRTNPTPSDADVAVTMVRQGSSQDNGTAPKATPVTPEDIVAARPKMDPEILIGLLRRARDSAILQPLYRDLYSGYSKKEVFFTSDSGSVKTTVTSVHRFSKEDAVVLQCVVENETDQPLTFDGRAATVLVANEVHPIKLLDCLRPIPAHTRTLCDIVLQGETDGSRANLSIDNEYRIELPSDSGNIWTLKNGSRPKTPFNIPPPFKSPITSARDIQ
jgi:hypothetical protein